MIFIVRGPEGQERIEVDENKPLGPQLSTLFSVEEIIISVCSNYEEVLNNDRTPAVLQLKHGQIIYVQYKKVSEEKQKSAKHSTMRRKESVFSCMHDANTMCCNCAPLDPWDEKYHKDNMIKYLSFGSYYEMAKSRKEKLVMEDYSVKPCEKHGLNVRCGECQEKEIVLVPQVFRMVDHVEFDDQKLVENFIKNWRDSGRQRFGVLVGTYTDYDMIPLGTKAVVSGIWEIDQENFPDGFVIPEPIDDVFSEMESGLEIVGMMYTDVQMNNGVVTSDRLIRDYFLSSLEIQFVAKMQLMHLYHITEKESGNRTAFGSRFVTIVVTAGRDGNIELLEYQVSNQCMALVKEDYILPTEDPKKFFTIKDTAYRTEKDVSMVKAEPYLPGDFFLVRLTHGCKYNPVFKNSEFVPKRFTAKKMAEYFHGDFSMKKISNFNLLMKMKAYFLEWKRLFKCIVKEDEYEFKRVIESTDFKNFIAMVNKYEFITWACQKCTYFNEKNMSTCEVCGSFRV